MLFTYTIKNKVIYKYKLIAAFDNPDVQPDDGSCSRESVANKWKESRRMRCACGRARLRRPTWSGRVRPSIGAAAPTSSALRIAAARLPC